MNGRDSVEDTGIDGMMILNGSERNRMGMCGLDLSDSG